WFSGVPGGVTLERTDTGATHKVKGGEPMVTLSGAPSELIMIAFGRREADVSITGDDEAVAAFREAKLGNDEDLLHPETD
ncbi:MAG: hypothetical protein K0U52_06485, partial [Gammaproteobacteria bacterium]|nr:hypothetical protein [Gammaproteobacteria bacterium]